MSRTDKDRPFWVRKFDPSERGGVDHWCGHPYSSYSPYRGEYFPCDLHLPPPLTEEEANERRCSPSDPASGWSAINPGWWTHHHQVAPRRRRDRDVLNEAVKWHRADPENFVEDFDLGYSEPYEPWYW